MIPEDECDFFSNLEVYKCRLLDQVFLELSFFDSFPWSFKTL